jgi:hypothetical protein
MVKKAKTSVGRPRKRDKVDIERDIRRYVKKSGGYKKGLSDEDMLRAQKVLREAGRLPAEGERPQWDMNVPVPGIDNPSVKDLIWPGMTQKS